MVTMTQTRKSFACRVMVRPAEYDQGKKSMPRQNERRPLGTSFRAWARRLYAGKDVELSPKLAKIVAGPRS